jgi:eukaryotic-like serine/threonine-protein kinase
MTTQVSPRIVPARSGSRPTIEPSPPHRPEPVVVTAPEPDYRWQHSKDEVIDGKYRLARPLGRGGMAEVWLAVHVHLKTEVALKFVSTALIKDAEQTAIILSRFQFEAQISARLSARTRHIVAVHDAGVHEGTPYLVMEYVPGRTLFGEIGLHGPMDPLRFADVLDDIADALTVAHGLGIVHRDLKPSNVMLIDEPDGRIRSMVADFGIAKATRADLDLDRPKDTSVTVLLGSPNYMSPEQIRSPSGLSAQSDVWSVGVLAYEALTDGLPFIGATAGEIILAVSTEAFMLPSKIRPSLSKAVDRWFLQALAKDPAQRFASVAEMARSYRAALGQAAAPRGVDARHKIPRLAAGLASLATVLVLAVLGWRGVHTPHPVRALRGVGPLVSSSVQESVQRAARELPREEGPASDGSAAAAPDQAPASPAEKPQKPGLAPPAATSKPGSPPTPPAPPSRKVFDKSEVL